MWIIQINYHQTQKKTIKLMEFVFKLYSKGLSFGGINYLTKYGLSPCLKSFKNFLKSKSERFNREIVDQISVNHPIFWIDNFSKFYRRTKLLNTGGTTNSLWTAIGTISGEWNLSKNTFFHLFPSSSIIYYNMVQQELQDIIKYENLSITYTYCERHNLWTIPLSVTIQDRFKFNFKPLSLTDDNICSNEGLKSVIKKLGLKFFKHNKWNIVLCDTNIFWRLCKKYYESPKPQSLRPIPIFGLWHPGKMLVECVWRSFLSYLIAPAYHYLYPNASILYKFRQSHALELFIQLYIAYKSWLDENELPDINETNDGWNQFKNSLLFFQFFLPLVYFL